MALNESYETSIAIIGVSGRFPGAAEVEAYWRNLAGGVCSIRTLTDSELVEAGVDPALLANPNYVKRLSTIEGIEFFDAAFFGFPPLIAETMDPQHRIFLECAWEALENAGYGMEVSDRAVGVFAGSATSLYLVNNIVGRMDAYHAAGAFQVDFNNTMDSLATTVSYKLNLMGPSLAVQTFCSSSLVATHLACQSLLNYECDMALAGGVALVIPQVRGYEYQEGGILSPDGHCRTFDAQAQGSVMGSGVGLTVLKRMQDALADGDHIYAVIRGSAVNNDGIRKVGFTAPGSAGQASVILSALSAAGVEAESVSYIEAHGTATPMGDAIELAAMMQAFGGVTKKKGFCAIGSVKPNIGHLDRAAGVAGLIKTALALEKKQIPPSLNFEETNADIDLKNSAFYVNTKLRDWERGEGPRRAGVSSFGLGGTNAHVVLEEAPEVEESDGDDGAQLLVLSAKNGAALEAAGERLARHLREHRELKLGDVAYTLQMGRSAFNHRRALVCVDVEDAIAGLESGRGGVREQTGRDRAVEVVGGGEKFRGWMEACGVKLGSGGERVEVVGEERGEWLEALGRAWLGGASVEWKGLWEGQRRRRVVLPGYAFQRKRYWLEAPREVEAQQGKERGKEKEREKKKREIGEWFYVPEWRESARAEAVAGKAGRWLVVGGEGEGIGELVAERLRAAGQEARVGMELGGWKTGGLPSGVVHLGSVDGFGEEAEGVKRFEKSLEKGFTNLVGVVRELGRQVVAERVEVVVVTRGMQALGEGERGDTEQATVVGLAKVIGQENVTLRCRCVDVEGAGAAEKAAEEIAAECLAGSRELTIAYRGGRRFTQGYARLECERGALRDRGVYVITGGMGGIGLALAEHMARTVKARLVLVGRSGANAEQRERIGAMEALGAEVLVGRADVADVEQLRAVVAEAEERFGGIDGVVHAAGITTGSGFAPLAELSEGQWGLQFRAKALGLYALEEVLGERRLDFCVLFSSLAAVLGGLGFGAYAAANSFMDAYAARHNRAGVGSAWTSVNWDTWRLKASEGGGLGATVAQYEMEVGEAVEAFERVLNSGAGQIVNSTGDLEQRVREWVELESLRGGEEEEEGREAARPGEVDYEQRIAEAWRHVLGVEQVGLHDNFFDLGGNSLIGLQLIARLKKEFQRAVPAVALFEAPTVAALAEYLRPEPAGVEDRQKSRLAERRRRAGSERSDIAIVAMAGRFPGADTVEEFWANLRDGVESLTRFTDEELLASGVDAGLLQDPSYVKARPILRDVEHFDAGLFGYTPREAELMDPQQRLFQECAWEALEKAGYDAQRYAGLIGVFGGTNLNMYLLRLAGDRRAQELMSDSTTLENDKDALTLNVSYRMNLRGPSVSVQTFCSTSLVATHMACRSLRNGDCDIALAGGVSVRVPVRAGYLYQEGDQVSHDGHCRTFDACADGTMFGDGVAMVVLKRLADALEDGDTIRAVIKGSAVNNDGGLKVGYTAPSVVGQSDVVRAALADAGVSAESIGYVEAHGTATRLGDPVEVASLIKAFGVGKRNYCALGSVKPNVGHLDRAAGVTGLIKTVMAMEQEELPATLHFERANPEIDFEASPFYVVRERQKWAAGGRPRRACVNSLGVGGTNAHVVVEEAPAMGASGPSREWQLLVLTGRSESALAAVGERLKQYLEGHEEVALGDVAYTLQLGRKVMEHRRMLVCRDVRDAVEQLGKQGVGKVQKAAARSVAFVFAGVGEHYAGWGKELYEKEGVFRTAVDRCCRVLQPLLGKDLKAVLLSGSMAGLRETSVAQPAAFVMDYALGQLWMSWGVRPGAVMGYSVGEYVAACVAGVMSLEDALTLVAKRAQLIQALDGGAMLAVGMGEGALGRWLEGGEEVWLAAVNSPIACVVAGSERGIAALEKRLAAEEIASRRVEAEHAYHTPLMRGAAGELTRLAGGMRMQAPRIPCISNVSGEWMTSAQALDGGYWAEHMCGAVRFAEGAGRLLEAGSQIVLEVGPGASLSSFIRQHPRCERQRMGEVLSSLPGAHERKSEVGALLSTLGKLWQLDVGIDWESFWGQERRRRIPLPTYPFERKRYWIEPERPAAVTAKPAVVSAKKTDLADWFYVPEWVPAPLLQTAKKVAGPWVVFAEAESLGERLAERMAQQVAVIRVERGERFERVGAGLFRIRVGAREDYASLLRQLVAGGESPRGIVHAWTLGCGGDFAAVQERGLYSMLWLTQELGEQNLDLSCAAVVLTEEENVASAPLSGACKVFAQEYLGFRCRSVSIDASGTSEILSAEMLSAEMLSAEVLSGAAESQVAYRGGVRLVERFAPLRLEAGASRVRQGGVYLIAGGLGKIGLAVAEHLARTAQARLVLVGRSAAGGEQRERIRAMEALGAEVLVLQGDVADGARMREVVAEAEGRFGALHGVVHTAGNVEGSWFVPARDMNRSHCETHFGAKVDGLYALEQALGERRLDFCVLFSSISSVLGGLGYFGYTAANSFMDAYTARHNRAGVGSAWTSVNWDTWRLKASEGGGLGATVAQYEMEVGEAVEAFERVLNSGAGQIVNSTGDLGQRVREWVELESLRGGEEEEEGREAARPGEVDYEQRIAEAWRHVLGVEQVGLHDNFFDLGGNSLIGLQLIARLKKEFQRAVPAVALFEAPTVAALAEYLRPEPAGVEDRQKSRLAERRRRAGSERSDIAIVAMAGRFPGADTVEEFWANLRDGVESLTRFTDEELLASGVDAGLLQDPSYVKARPILRDVEHFDAGLFGYTPREAELMDPQQRLFQECAWEALEKAGYDAQRYTGLIGVFGGTNLNTYLMRMASDRRVQDLMTESTVLENDKDALTLNVSYRLNLRGPSVSVQTFCSTSLVATHMACRSLRNGDCDMALAGGVSVRVPVRMGHLFREGGQESPDGSCRSFDCGAQGTVWGDGVAMVVLKRLADALEDGDTIRAVIKGSAVNNDGGLKVGYTAPSVVGQSDVVRAALADAGVSAESIGYVEAHGTATRLGDPVEVASLIKAFGVGKRNYCALGSVKPNVGHLDRAAGVTGLIKTVMAMEQEELPATLHFERANPEIDFEASPFYVVRERQKWAAGGRPRRACVNSLGVGGTNAHVVVEEAPAMGASGPSREWQLLVLTGRSESALAAVGERLKQYLEGHEEVALGDVAYTLQLGRKVMEHRRMLVCRDVRDAVEQLGKQGVGKVQKAAARSVAFVFAGVGEHYAGWGKELYEKEGVFRTAVDRCCRVLQPLLGKDLKAVLLSGSMAGLRETSVAQPAAFVMDYALGQLWMSWGVRPGAVMGYSVGEYVAACVAGVMSLEDALTLVAKRAQLIQALDGGAMLAVGMGEGALGRWLEGGEEVWLAAVNSPIACVVAGSERGIAALEKRLAAEEIASRRVEAEHAYHTPLMRGAAGELTRLAGGMRMQAPRIPCISNVSGEWMTSAQALDGGYWAEHMCGAVRFAEGAGRLLEAGSQIVLEVGPGASLSSFIRQHPRCERQRMGEVLSSLPGAHERKSEVGALLSTLGKLWQLDVGIDWESFWGQERRRRIPLPTYPFERKRYWVDPSSRPGTSQGGTLQRQAKVEDWFSVASWKRAASVEAAKPAVGQVWLLLIDEEGVGRRLAEWLGERGQEVITVVAGSGYGRLGQGAFTVRAGERADYAAVLGELERQGRLPQRVVHLWGVGEEEETEKLLERGFYSLLALAQALGDSGVESCHVDVVTSGMQEVTGSERLAPGKATVLGPVKVIPQEYPNLTSRSIDISLPVGEGQLGAVLLGRGEEDVVALRGRHVWVQRFEPMRLGAEGSEGGSEAGSVPLREGGVYLLTGGLGGIALGMAEDLARRYRARLALVGRRVHANAQAVAERLEALGAEVLVLQADVAEPGQIAAAVEATIARFGSLQGVLHTAGVPGIGLMQLKEAASAGQVLRPKVQGTEALGRALAGVPVEFVVLFSSVTSATGGGPGQVDYCAGNAYLDAWARKETGEGRRTISISWGEWQWDAWQEGLLGYPVPQREYLKASRRYYGIDFAGGAEALRRALGSGQPHLFVTTQDLAAMVEGSRHSSAATALARLDEQRRDQPRHPRPELATSYVACAGEMEKKIAALWSQTLGIEPIGADDNFFDLGGNSLLGIGIIAHLRKDLKLNLPAQALYEAPTVRALAELLTKPQHHADALPKLEEETKKRREKLAKIKRFAQSELV